MGELRCWGKQVPWLSTLWFRFPVRMMPVRHRSGPAALTYCVDRTREEGSVSRGPFKNSPTAHREAQMSLALPALRGLRGFLSRKALMLIQRCELGSLRSALGKSLARQSHRAGWQLGTYLLKSPLPVRPLQVTSPS